MNKRRMNLRFAAVATCGLLALCACGQKGALYLPDHAPQLVLPAPAAAPAAAAPAAADAATSPDAAATAPDTTATRKAPRDPDPATAR